MKKGVVCGKKAAVWGAEPYPCGDRQRVGLALPDLIAPGGIGLKNSTVNFADSMIRTFDKQRFMTPGLGGTGKQKIKATRRILRGKSLWGDQVKQSRGEWLSVSTIGL